MGKRKIDMVKIQDKGKRIITFSKRRGGLFKKAADYCRLSGANVALLVFSPAGKPFTFGHPSADAVFDRFLSGTNRKEEEEEEYNKTIDHNNNADDHQRRADLGDEGDGFWWDNIDMEELDSMEKIQAVKNAMLGLQQNVRQRIDELTSSSASASSSYTAAAITTTTTTGEDSSLFTSEGDDFLWPSCEELEKLADFLDDDNDVTCQKLPPFTDQQADLLPGLPSDNELSEFPKILNDDDDDDETWQQLSPLTDHQAELLQGLSSDDELAKLAAKILNDGNDETWQQLSPFTDHQSDLLPVLSSDDELWRIFSIRDECTAHDR